MKKQKKYKSPIIKPALGESDKSLALKAVPVIYSVENLSSTTGLDPNTLAWIHPCDRPCPGNGWVCPTHYTPPHAVE